LLTRNAFLVVGVDEAQPASIASLDGTRRKKNKRHQRGGAARIGPRLTAEKKRNPKQRDYSRLGGSAVGGGLEGRLRELPKKTPWPCETKKRKEA